MASKDYIEGGPHENSAIECDEESKAPDVNESRKRKASEDALESTGKKVSKEDEPLDNLIDVDKPTSSNAESSQLEATGDGERQPRTVETMTTQWRPSETMTICGIIWPQGSIDAAAGVEISREGKPVAIQLTSGVSSGGGAGGEGGRGAVGRGAGGAGGGGAADVEIIYRREWNYKPVGIQLTSGVSSGGGGGGGGEGERGGGGSCRFIVDAALRSSDLTWEVLPFEKKWESGRLQLFERSSVAKKGSYVDLFPASTALQVENSNVKRRPTATHHDLTITVRRTTYREATIEWTSDVPEVDRWLIIIRNEGRTPRLQTDQVKDSEWMIHSDDKSLNRIDQSLVSLEYEAGYKYTVAVYGLREETTIDEIRRYAVVANSTASFRAEHTKEDLERLLVKARAIKEVPMGNRFRKFRDASYDLGRCQWLYREKPAKYFRELEMEHDNVMKVLDKDANGDPASVINGQLKGLFFRANVDFATNLPREIPIFGDIRVMIPALNMLSEDCKIYFADLYCLDEFHTVTLVLAELGSKADQFCAEKLVCLSRTDGSDNPFLFVENGTVRVKSRITVEVFYTKNIDLNLLTSEYNGRREKLRWEDKRHGGKWKSRSCPTCNLYTSTLPGAFPV